MIKLEKIILHKVNSIKTIHEYLFMLKQTINLINKNGYIPQKSKLAFYFRLNKGKIELCEHKAGFFKSYLKNEISCFDSSKKILLKEIFSILEKKECIEFFEKFNLHKNNNKIIMINCDNEIKLFEKNNFYFSGFYLLNKETYTLKPFDISYETINNLCQISKLIPSEIVLNNNYKFDEFIDFIKDFDSLLYKNINDDKMNKININKTKLSIRNKKYDPFSKFIVENINNSEIPNVRNKYFVNYIILRLNSSFYKFIVDKKEFISFFVHDKKNNILIKINNEIIENKDLEEFKEEKNILDFKITLPRTY